MALCNMNIRKDYPGYLKKKKTTELAHERVLFKNTLIKNGITNAILREMKTNCIFYSAHNEPLINYYKRIKNIN